MTKSFAIMWQRANKRRRSPQKRQRLDSTKQFIFLTNEPFIRRRFLYRELLERIKKARRYIRLTTPYFVPDGKLAHALRRAARRGVEVSLLIPNHSDKRLVDLAAQGYFSGLLKSGVNIYWGGERFNHTKAGTIDGEWGTLGSLNLDSASLWYNFEGNIVTNDVGFITALDEQFIDDCRSAELIDIVRWHNRPWYLKFLAFCVSPLRLVL
jgi:cardiolipin synthase